MKRLTPTLLATTLAAWLLTPPPQHAAEPAPQPPSIQSIAQQHQDAVLFLHGALKYLCGRCSKDHDHTVNGTALVVDPNGLFLARTEGPLGDPKAEIKEANLHVRLPDGTELPVRAAVTDTDLRVVILTPEKPAPAGGRRLKALDPEPAAQPGVMDELVVLRRLDGQVGYALNTSLATINAIDPKPRRTYLSANLAGERPVAACFDRQGRLAGFALGHETAIATEEFLDLIRQGRQALARNP